MTEGSAPDPPVRVKRNIMAQVRAEAALFDAARARGTAASKPEIGSVRRWWLSLRERPWAPAGVPALACALLLLLGAGGLATSGPQVDRSAPAVVRAQIDRQFAPGASGSLEVRGTRARLRVDGLPTPGRGRAYQVWVRSDREAPRPGGAMLPVDSRGRGETTLPGPIGGVDQVLVTSEPQGGSDVPTRVPVLQVGI